MSSNISTEHALQYGKKKNGRLTGHHQFLSLFRKKVTPFECGNNRTISLISHSSKILLKIIANRMQNKLNAEIAEEQAGFRPGKGTRN